MIENNPLAVADDLSIDSEFWQWAVKSNPKKLFVSAQVLAIQLNIKSKIDLNF